MASWEDYITGMLKSKEQPDGSWLQEIVDEAAILLKDGTMLACTPGFTLGKYEFDAPTPEGTTKKLPIDEAKILTELALKGNAKVYEIGIRINNTKYTLANFMKGEEEGLNVAYLSKAQGGACVATSKTTIVFASYNTTKPMSNKVMQNAGMCNTVVEGLAKFLADNGS